MISSSKRSLSKSTEQQAVETVEVENQFHITSDNLSARIDESDISNSVSSSHQRTRAIVAQAQVRVVKQRQRKGG